jgi:hypothetical protein
VADGLHFEYNESSCEERKLMKKLVLSLFMLVMFGAIGYGAYLYMMAPHQVFCTRLIQLCDVKNPEALEACNEVLQGVAERQGDAMRKAATCAVETDSCTGATGCLVGAGANISLNELAPLLNHSKSLLNDFVDGVKGGAGGLFE